MWTHEPVAPTELRFGEFYHHTIGRTCQGDELPYTSFIALGVPYHEMADSVASVSVGHGWRETWTSHSAEDVCRITWVRDG
jgi:hypothetical protein